MVDLLEIAKGMTYPICRKPADDTSKDQKKPD